MSQINSFTLPPESSGKTLKGFEQGVTQSSLWLGKITGGYVEGMARCGVSAGVGWSRGREKQTYGVMVMWPVEVPG